MLYLITTMTAAGMFHAATAYLPSTFAMYTTMLGMTAFMDRSSRGGLKTVEGVFWFAVGGLLGWPFSMAMVAPFIVAHLFVGFSSNGVSRTVTVFVKAALCGLAVLVYPTIHCIGCYFTNYMSRQLSQRSIPGHISNLK